jgi:protoporphyrin/coproporphyrin ferrochelatase
MKKKIAVVISSHGEVDTPSVKAYYQNMKHIFRHVSEVMPIPKPAQVLIPPIGAVLQTIKTKKQQYRSPMNRISAAQAENITHELNRLAVGSDVEIQTFNVYETTPPYTEDLLPTLNAFDGVVILTMNPMDSDFSSGAMERLAEHTFHAAASHKVCVMKNFWNSDALSDLYAAHVVEKTVSMNLNPAHKNGLIVALHGTVVADAKGVPVAFRNGLMENETLFQKLAARLNALTQNPFVKIERAYLNHEVGGKWSSPTLDETIADFKSKGIESAWLFAAGYYADNSETEFAAKGKLEQSGFRSAHYITCVNESPAFAALMSESIMQSVREKFLAHQNVPV